MIGNGDSQTGQIGSEPPMLDDLRTPQTLRGTGQQRRPLETRADTLALPNIGEVLNDIYEIRSILGEGGMGRVYEGHDRLLNRTVAIKIAWPEVGFEQLYREAQAMAALRGRGLPDVYAIGQHRGIDYYVMERLHGDTLATLIEAGEPESRLPLAEALDILIGVARALASVHGAGLIHRDLKPSNIMLAPDNHIVLLDFGVFRTEGDMSDSSTLYGSPRYIAPEAIEGKIRIGQAHLVDIYALGVISFELLAGAPPFVGRRVPQLLIKHLTQAPPSLVASRPDAPASLERLIHEMLAKDPDERPLSAEAVETRLRAIGTELRGSPGGPAMTVLVIEDEPPMRMFLEACVACAVPGASVITASSGAQALALIARHAPTLLLLDLRVHDMSALELCMSLHSAGAPRGIEMVAVSAHTTEGDRELLRRLGVSNVIGTDQPGPDLMAELTALLRQLARRIRRAP